jgi:hypothetical protein
MVSEPFVNPDNRIDQRLPLLLRRAAPAPGFRKTQRQIRNTTALP